MTNTTTLNYATVDATTVTGRCSRTVFNELYVPAGVCVDVLSTDFQYHKDAGILKDSVVVSFESDVYVAVTRARKTATFVSIKDGKIYDSITHPLGDKTEAEIRGLLQRGFVEYGYGWLQEIRAREAASPTKTEDQPKMRYEYTCTSSWGFDTSVSEWLMVKKSDLNRCDFVSAKLTADMRGCAETYSIEDGVSLVKFEREASLKDVAISVITYRDGNPTLDSCVVGRNHRIPWLDGIGIYDADEYVKGADKFTALYNKYLKEGWVVLKPSLFEEEKA